MNDRIKEIRVAFGMTQTDFGNKIGISQNYIWMLESGVREPSERVIRDICREFGVNETWLRTGDGDMMTALTREEEMAETVARLMSTAPDSFKASLVSVMLRFDPNGPEWEVVGRIYRSVAAEIEKGPGQ